MKLTTEVTKAIANAIRADLSALHISPANTLNDIFDDEYDVTYPRIVDALNPRLGRPDLVRRPLRR